MEKTFLRILQEMFTFITSEKKSSVLSIKTHFLFKNKPKFRTYLRNFYYFSRILRQIYYNLVLRNSKIQNRPSVILPWQLASKRKEKHGVEWMNFLPCSKYGRKIINFINGVSSVFPKIPPSGLSIFVAWLPCASGKTPISLHV